MQATSLPSQPRATAFRTRARSLLRLGLAFAGTVGLVLVGANPLEELGADAIVVAPNRGRPAPASALPGETLVAVGPPTATLSLEIVDAPSPRGTVFVLHGIRDSKDSMRGWARLLASAGLRAVLVDSRGHGRSSGDSLTYGVQESRDLASALDALAARGEVTGKVGVLGVSYGAATALEWAGRDARVRAVLAVAPFASLRAVVPGYTPVRLPAAFVSRAIELAGERGGFDPDEASPLDAIGRTDADVLLVHGDADAKIPVAQSRSIFARRPDHTELVVVPGAGHDDVLGSPAADLARRAPAWLGEHLR
jgi:pimeloyl-ACP methyl ester carboxylesterase